jgi:ribosome-binding factor A
MRFFRNERVSSVIRERLSNLILREVETPGALVTVTDVDVDRKLERAIVRVSILPSEQVAPAFKKLARSAGELQFKLSREMNIRPMPRIQFQLDHGLENAANVEKALLQEHTGEDSAAR